MHKKTDFSCQETQNMGNTAHKGSFIMKITALVILVGIGFLAWYHYPDSPPDTGTSLTAPATAPLLPEPLKGPEQLATVDEACRGFESSTQWPYLKKAYPGLSDAALCDYMLAPDVYDEDESGYCKLLLENVPPALEKQARMGEANCPEGAIEIEED